MQTEIHTRAAFEIGRRAWPDIPLPFDRFADRISATGVAQGDLSRNASDLFLAVACAEGDPQALAHFETHVLSHVDMYVRRFALSQAATDEVRQRVRIKLLTGPSPNIARYRGRGPLAAWVRVTTARIAIDVTGTTTRETLADQALLELGTSPMNDPEMNAAKNLYRDRFRQALEESLAALDVRDTTLLQLYVLEGLSFDGIGTIYRVHRATVARWFVAIRARLFERVREHMGLRSTPSPSEVRSLVALLQDEIHLSAARVLRARAVTEQPLEAEGAQEPSDAVPDATPSGRRSAT